MEDGLNNQVAGAYRSWSTSSRSSSTDTAATETFYNVTGIHNVAAAGNNNQRLGIGSSDVDRLNYMTDAFYGTTDPRSCLLYTSPSPRDGLLSRMPSSA